MYIIPDHFNGKKTVTEASVAALQPNLRNRPIINIIKITIIYTF